MCAFLEWSDVGSSLTKLLYTSCNMVFAGERCLKLHRFMLIVIGLWPYQKSFVWRIQTVFFFISFCCNIIFQVYTVLLLEIIRLISRYIHVCTVCTLYVYDQIIYIYVIIVCHCCHCIFFYAAYTVSNNDVQYGLHSEKGFLYFYFFRVYSQLLFLFF